MREKWGHRVTRGIKAQQEHQAKKDHKVIRVLKVHRVIKDTRANRVIPD
jgi:hypothetical protein